LSMIVAFPVEGQPIWLVIPTAIAMLLFGGWIVQQTIQGLKLLWHDPMTRDSVMIIGSFLMIVLIEFLIIIFGLGKNIAQVPRYNFIYYPAVALLIGAGLARQGAELKLRSASQPLVYLVLIGGLSALFLNANLAFQKPFRPELVASQIAPIDPTTPTMVVMAYYDYQELAMGLSFVFALRDVNPQVKFLFLDRTKGYEPIYKVFPNLPTVQEFWLIAPGLVQPDFPNLAQVGKTKCSLVPDRHHRIGIPYQGYKCG
jgi:hypothetical protein